MGTAQACLGRFLFAWSTRPSLLGLQRGCSSPHPIRVMKHLTKLLLTALLFTTPANATPPEIDCLARVMYHEASGEGERGQKAVGYVVINRSKSGHFPNNICKVVTQPKQFSNFSLRRSIPAQTLNNYKTLASQLISSYSRISDPTRGALFFHSTAVRPAWRGLRYTITIGRHIFYKR